MDKDAIRKRPFRDKEVRECADARECSPRSTCSLAHHHPILFQIRHEAEAAMFAIYGHWVNRGFHYSRDLLFANKPRAKKQRKME